METNEYLAILDIKKWIFEIRKEFSDLSFYDLGYDYEDAIEDVEQILMRNGIKLLKEPNDSIP